MPDQSENAVVIISDSEDDVMPPQKRKNAARGPTAKDKDQKRPLKRLRKAAKTTAETEPGQDVARQGRIVFSCSQPESPEQSQAAPKKGSLFALLSSAPTQSQQPQNRPQSSSKPHWDGKLWSSKHAPQTEADLIVHKKKLTQLREFLQPHATEEAAQNASKFLFITGPPGCGKTSSVRIVAASLGLQIVEWEAPVPTLWSEHLLQADREQRYVSKLDAFDSFVAHAKLAPLGLSSVSDPADSRPQKKRKVVLVDDLPHAAGRDQRLQLTNAISRLAESARSPVVIIMTTSLSAAERKNSGQGATHILQSELSRLVVEADGVEVAFNAIPALSGSKTLLRIAQAEGLQLTPLHAKLLIENSSGDLLNAIETLQLYSQGKIDRSLIGKKAKKGKKGRSKDGKKEGEKLTEEEKAAMRPLQRDQNLSTFHALGRLLYNKREGDPGVDVDDSASIKSQSPLLAQGDAPAITISQEFERRRMVYNPEEVVLASGMEASQILGFLQENYLDFVDEQSIEDVANAAAYFADADRLSSHDGMSGLASQTADESAGHSMREACSYCVASRGLMWANAHPAPKRWLPLKASQLNNVSKALEANLQQLQSPSERRQRMGETGQQTAVETLPYLRLLTSFPIAAHLLPLLPSKWARLWQGTLVVEPQAVGPVMPSALDNMQGLDEAIEDSDSDSDFAIL